MKKLQKSRTTLTRTHNEKVELEKFMKELENLMPQSEQRDIAMTSCQKKLKEFENQLAALN